MSKALSTKREIVHNLSRPERETGFDSFSFVQRMAIESALRSGDNCHSVTEKRG